METREWEPKVYNNVLECIGNTPLVKFNRIPKEYGLKCKMYAKCEYVNPGGSVKDRIAHAMVVDGEKNGLINSKTRLIEPTSGNTGIGIALTSAIRGYDCTIVTPDKNSAEKMSTMGLLGADIVQTPASAGHNDPDGFMAVTKKLLKKYHPYGLCLDQYDNGINPLAHYEHTAQEIIDALGTVDMFVMGVGTGGTVTGVARKLKEHNPNCVIVAVDPKGSIIYGEGHPVPFFVEGIGGDFVPNVFDKHLINKVVKTTDCQSFNMSREMIRKEGFLCGGSSGAITYAAVQVAQELNLGPDKNLVVILPDGIRNYMTKFVCDQWMEAQLFKKPPNREFKWYNRSISEIKMNSSVPSINKNKSCMDALLAMEYENNVAFIVDDKGYLQGVVSKDSLRSEATNPKSEEGLNFNEPVIKHQMKNYYKIANTYKSTIGLASRILDITPFVVVVEERLNDNNNIIGSIPKGIITPDMVLEYIINNQN